MGNGTLDQRMLRLLADILDYPTPHLVERVKECLALALSLGSGAAAPLSSFHEFVRGASQGHIEEVYTGTFDLDASCHPYVGYHLLGESYKRSIFLLELKEQYRAQGYTTGEGELPDRLSEMLRFLAVSADDALNQEIVQEALLPVLGQMTKEEPEEADGDSPGDASPYRQALLALETLLSERIPATAGAQEASYTGGGADD